MAPDRFDDPRPEPASTPTPRRRIARPAVIVATAAVLAATGTGNAVAATTAGGGDPGSNPAPAVGAAAHASGSTGTPVRDRIRALVATADHNGTTTKKPARPGAKGFHRFGGPGFGMFGGARGAVRGEIVVPKKGGGYQTVTFQRGTVTSVSGTSVTVKSPDGTSRTYAVNADTIVRAKSAGIGAVKVKDNVFVTAKSASGTPSASTLVDLTQVQAARKNWNGPRPR